MILGGPDHTGKTPVKNKSGRARGQENSERGKEEKQLSQGSYMMIARRITVIGPPRYATRTTFRKPMDWVRNFIIKRNPKNQRRTASPLEDLHANSEPEQPHTDEG